MEIHVRAGRYFAPAAGNWPGAVGAARWDVRQWRLYAYAFPRVPLDRWRSRSWPGPHGPFDAHRRDGFGGEMRKLGATELACDHPWHVRCSPREP